MATIESVVEKKLRATESVNAAVKGNIFPSYRDDVTPSLVYDLSIDEVDNTYELTGAIAYELVVSCIADTLLEAINIGDKVIEALDREDWSDGGFYVEVFYRDREKDYIDKGSKNKRLGVVD